MWHLSLWGIWLISVEYIWLHGLTGGKFICTIGFSNSRIRQPLRPANGSCEITHLPFFSPFLKPAICTRSLPPSPLLLFLGSLVEIWLLGAIYENSRGGLTWLDQADLHTYTSSPSSGPWGALWDITAGIASDQAGKLSWKNTHFPEIGENG